MNSVYESSDIKSCAYLLSVGYLITSTKRLGSRKFVFYFENTPELKESLALYWADKSVINPRLLFDNYDHLKDLIFQS